MGGVAIVTHVLNMIRIKFAAVLIGTTGVGLLANFTAIQGLVGTIAGLGIQSSAVRAISAAYVKGDNQNIGEIILTIRRICLLTGVLGALGVLLLSSFISQISFSSSQYQWDIAAIGLIILFANLSGGQTAILQGARKITSLAKTQVISATVGTVTTICLYFWLGMRGIIPSLFLISIAQFVCSWYFVKQLLPPKVSMTWKASFIGAGSMVRQGAAMMSAALINSAFTFATIALISKQIDVNAAGIYSAALSLSGIFVNFVLNSMSTEYYPRLASLISNQPEAAKAVREQSEIALLLAMPGLALTMFTAPWIVTLFYSIEFESAVNLIEIFILGCFGRVVAWPLGFVVIAAGKALLFFAIELSLLGLQFVLIIVFLPSHGLDAVAWAFTLVALLNILVESVVSKHLIGYSWDSKKLFTVLISALIITGLYLNASIQIIWIRHLIGLLIVFTVFFYCTRILLIYKNSV